MDFSRDYSTDEFIEALILDELEQNDFWYQYKNRIIKILKHFMGINYDCDYLTLYKIIMTEGNATEKELYKKLWINSLRGLYISSKVNKELLCSNLVIIDIAEYIKENSFTQVQIFVNTCKNEIKHQLKIINNKELKKIPLLIIFSEINDEVKDTIYCYLEDVCKCKPCEWEKLYNIILI